MHMDLYGGVMLLPWIKILDNIDEKYKLGFITLIQPSKNEVNLSNRPSDVESMSIYNLYYNGKWHKPVKGTYWKHNDILLANATRYAKNTHAVYSSILVFVLGLLRKEIE